MREIDYGYVHLKLKDIMAEQKVSINRLSCRTEMQRTQLKAYINESVQRVDLSILARLCYVLDCNLSDLLEYIPPEKEEDSISRGSPDAQDPFC